MMMVAHVLNILKAHILNVLNDTECTLKMVKIVNFILCVFTMIKISFP